MATSHRVLLRRAVKRRRGIPVRPLNMAHWRRSSEKSSWFLKSHVEDPPVSASEMQDKLRACGHSFLERIRRFGGGVLRRADAFWAERSEGVDARLHYHVEQGNGAPTLYITGSCAELRCPELLERLEGRIYVAILPIAGTTRRVAIRLPRINPPPPLEQEFPSESLSMYIKDALTHLIGAQHPWRRFEIAKYSGQIHFHMYAICADMQPHRLLREMEGGGPREIADALAKWEGSAPAIPAMRPGDTPWGRPRRNQRMSARRRAAPEKIRRRSSVAHA